MADETVDYDRIDMVLDLIAAANTPEALAERARMTEAARSRWAERAVATPEWRRDRGTWSLRLYCAQCEPIITTLRATAKEPPTLPRLRVVHAEQGHQVVQQAPDGHWEPYGF